MNELRLILLIAGVAVIAGLYLWENRRQRDWQRRSTVLHEPRDPGLPGMRMQTDAGAVESAPGSGDSLPRPPAPGTAPGIGTTSNPARQPAPTTAPAVPHLITKFKFTNLFSGSQQGEPLDPRRIIAVHLASPPGTSFRGPDIVSAGAAAGLHLGVMKIFHHIGAQTGNAPRPLFSMANMYEPGYFEVDSMNSFTTRGLTLFMCLFSPREDGLALELMIKTAEFLADALGGEVQGPDRQRLDARALGRLRDHARGGWKTGRQLHNDHSG